MVPRLGDLRLELLLTKIERTEKVWGSKREYPELCLDMLSLRCSFAIQWEINSWHSWDSGERFRELVFYQPVDGIWSHEVGWDHVGNMCRQKRELQGLDTPTFPGQRATRGKTRKKSEEKQTRMVPWKTEESVSGNRIISCQILPIGQGRWGLRNDYWFGNVNVIGDLKKRAVSMQIA